MSNWSWLRPHGVVPNDRSAHNEEPTGSCSLPTSDNKITASNNASASRAHETTVLRNVTRLCRNAIGFESAAVIVWTLSRDTCVERSRAKAPRRQVNLRLLSRSEEHTSELQSRLHLVCRL